MNPLPCIDIVFSLVIQQKRELYIPLHDLPPSDASRQSFTPPTFLPILLKSNPNGKGHDPPRGINRICIPRGRTNHILDTCFVKHNYPLGFKNKGKTSQENGFDDSKGNNNTSDAKYSSF